MAVFIFIFFVYLYSAVPVIYFEDNPQFINAAYTLGLTHPPGYPLTDMLGNIAGMAPLGNFAFRCNLLAALLCAVAVTFFYLCARLLTGEKGVATVAALLFGLSGSIWTQAVIFEVYPLHYALFFGVLWIALSGRLVDFRWLMLSAFLFGLGVSNHLSFSLSLVPFVILWFSWRGTWLYRLTVSRFFVVCGAGFYSWGVQFYTMARSASPGDYIFFSWGRVEDFSTFLFNIFGMVNITGLLYDRLPFNAGSGASRLDVLMDYAVSAMPVSAWGVTAVLTVAGLVTMARRDRWTAVAFFVAIPLLSAYTLIHLAALDIMLVLPWGLALLLSAYGISRLPETARRWTAAGGALVALCLGVVTFPVNDRHRDYTAYDYMIDVADSLPEGGWLKLAPGVDANYIVQYANPGPARYAGYGRTKENPDIFDTSLYEDLKKTVPYGLLNTNAQTIDRHAREEVWSHLRSFPFPADVRRYEGATLTRDVLKARLLARVALQRGYMLYDLYDASSAMPMFAAAARLHPDGVYEEASVWQGWGETERAKLLVEALIKARPSPRLVRLLTLIEGGAVR